jgi:hypothetical protein
MSFTFHPEAEVEFKEAIEYYDNIGSLLGYDFAIEVYCAIKHAVSFTKAWPTTDDSIHRTLVKRFPYGVLYAN